MKLTATTPEADRFIKEWNDPKEYITAYTSGSTGTPKEIRLLKSDMARSAEATCSYFKIDSRSTLLCPLSADYIAGKMMIVRAIVSGAELVMESPSNSPLKSDIGPIDLLPIVPSQAPGLLEKCRSGYQIRNVIAGGAPMSAETEKEMAAAPFASYATYGMTETCSHVAVRRLGSGQIYESMPGITFDTDAENCLRINAPEFSFGTLQTNDIVELKDSRHFTWLGRRDNVIITGGLKVIPESVENRVRDLIGHEFYIVGRRDPKWGEAVIMMIESEDELVTEQIQATLKHRLKKWELPKEIIVRKRFARTASGKIIRSAE